MSDLHAHLIFVTKYRRKVFTAQILDALKTVLLEVCASLETELQAFKGEQDHVHLLVAYPPKVSLSNLVNRLKGASSHQLRRDLPAVVRRYRKGVLWSPSDFAASCGGAPLEIIRQYIEQQDRPT